MFRSLKKAVIERAMSAELGDHLGYCEGEIKPDGQSNQRNGTSGKTVITDDGPVRIEVPRDREGSFEPQIIGKHERRFTSFDQKIIAMYARGMTVREIRGYVAEMYGTEVSAEITAWQSRPLEPMYPVVFFDALRVKIRGDAIVRNKAVCLALAALPDGSRDVLGTWIEQTEGAKFWPKVFNAATTRVFRRRRATVQAQGRPVFRLMPGRPIKQMETGRRPTPTTWRFYGRERHPAILFALNSS